MEFHELLLESYKMVVEQALPENCLPKHLPGPPKGRTYVIGAGKAAAKMAQVFEANYPGDFTGVVITRYGFVADTQKIKVLEASHPQPDQAGVDGAKEILEFLSQTSKDDLVIFLLSGGGSSLLTCPLDGVDFGELQDLNKQLLECGASIYEINCVRKHLNKLFGGRLTRAASPAKILTLAISDVAGDDPSTIASGPSVGDPSTLEDAKRIIKKYALNASKSIIQCLDNSENETPKPDDACFENSEYVLIATPEKSLKEAVNLFQKNGINAHILSSEFEGDTNECAALHTAIVKRIISKDEPFKKPCALISGGETTVVVKGSGQGGPNTQFILKALMDLEDNDVYALAGDTDGIDGSMDNAGAFITPETYAIAKEKGLDIRASLDNNDSYSFFEALDSLLMPGPTHTNINDYRVFVIK